LLIFLSLERRRIVDALRAMKKKMPAVSPRA